MSERIVPGSYHGYVYKSTNLLNGRVYIGQHRGIFNRKYLGSGLLIRRALKKYGRKNFSLHLLAIAFIEEQLNALEKIYIKKYRKKYSKKVLYNLVDGGKGISGWKHSAKFKEWQSRRNTGCKNPMFGVHLFGKSNPSFGMKRSEEQRECMHQAHVRSIKRGSLHGNYGRKHSRKSILKIQIGKKGSIPWNKGIKHRSNSIRKMQIARLKYYAERR